MIDHFDYARNSFARNTAEFEAAPYAVTYERDGKPCEERALDWSDATARLAAVMSRPDVKAVTITKRKV